MSSDRGIELGVNEIVVYLSRRKIMWRFKRERGGESRWMDFQSYPFSFGRRGISRIEAELPEQYGYFPHHALSSISHSGKHYLVWADDHEVNKGFLLSGRPFPEKSDEEIGWMSPDWIASTADLIASSLSFLYGGGVSPDGFSGEIKIIFPYCQSWSEEVGRGDIASEISSVFSSFFPRSRRIETRDELSVVQETMRREDIPVLDGTVFYRLAIIMDLNELRGFSFLAPRLPEEDLAQPENDEGSRCIGGDILPLYSEDEYRRQERIELLASLISSAVENYLVNAMDIAEEEGKEFGGCEIMLFSGDSEGEAEAEAVTEILAETGKEIYQSTGVRSLWKEINRI